MSIAFKAYDTSGILRLVGGGNPPTLGKHPGIRWEIGAVERFTFATSAATLAFIVAESARIAR